MSPTLLHVDPVQRYLRGVVLCSVPERGKQVALTFDDGPNPRNTPRLLDLLGSRNVPATFFVLGARLNCFGEISQRAHEAIERWTGRRPRFFRPPMGWFSHRCVRVLEQEGYQPVIGNIHPEDSRRRRAEAILDRIRGRVEPGSIIILHDGG